MATPIPFKEFLAGTLKSETAHYLWLRSLSYLEYIGYRKMVKALGHQDMAPGTFHHLSDEIRHSFMLKELAQSSFEKKFQDIEVQKSFIHCAEGYFQEIDQYVHQWVEGQKNQGQPFLCYLLVSYLIEKRAMIVYPHYHSQLSEPSAKAVIQKIIKDEGEHLEYLKAQLETHPEAKSFEASGVWDFEESRFASYLGEFNQCLREAIH